MVHASSLATACLAALSVVPPSFGTTGTTSDASGIQSSTQFLGSIEADGVTIIDSSAASKSLEGRSAEASQMILERLVTEAEFESVLKQRLRELLSEKIPEFDEKSFENAYAKEYPLFMANLEDRVENKFTDCQIHSGLLLLNASLMIAISVIYPILCWKLVRNKSIDREAEKAR